MQRRWVGAWLDEDRNVNWRVWAPRAQQVSLVIVDETGPLEMRPVEEAPMVREEDGFFVFQRRWSGSLLYGYRLDGGPVRPDPASRFQPYGPQGPSSVLDLRALPCSPSNWKGVPRSELVIYELHVGTFTPEGTFDAIIPRLRDLSELGITAIEIMPVAQFPGMRNWGYDGVDLFAVQNSYGGPSGLARLIDACHATNVAVILDVVYNHFGPEGAFWNEFGPYLTDAYRTPWGSAINFDGPHSDGVRMFYLENVRMWLEDYRADGLRLDAVHAIYDHGARHILEEIAEEGRAIADRRGREIHVLAESDLNDPRLLRDPAQGGYGVNAQWSDDLHHAVHAWITGERHAYYEDFGRAEQVVEAFRTPFLFQGQYSPSRRRRHGAPPDGLSADRFIVALQNHDQVGNRACGDRIDLLIDGPARRLATSLVLLSPYIPLLFMGEEYGERNPFPFFCSFQEAQLIEAVRLGRHNEFAAFMLAAKMTIPDAACERTFEEAKLAWAWPSGSPEAQLRGLYRDLLGLRRRYSELRHLTPEGVSVLRADGAPGVVRVFRPRLDDNCKSLVLYFNLGTATVASPKSVERPETLLFSSEAESYGGQRRSSEWCGTLFPYEAALLEASDPVV